VGSQGAMTVLCGQGFWLHDDIIMVFAHGVACMGCLAVDSHVWFQATSMYINAFRYS
jgi:hypothetical protein